MRNKYSGHATSKSTISLKSIVVHVLYVFPDEVQPALFRPYCVYLIYKLCDHVEAASLLARVVQLASAPGYPRLDGLRAEQGRRGGRQT